MTIDKARSIIAEFIAQWSTEKLCQVKAFAEDGRMEWDRPCQCLVGVHISTVLHREEKCEGPSSPMHWHYWHQADHAYLESIEHAYYALSPFRYQRQLDAELIAILTAELDRRAAKAEAAEMVEVGFIFGWIFGRRSWR